jgi:putative solute:sodium symporter small subunit
MKTTPAAAALSPHEARTIYWRRVKRLTAQLLCVWFFLTFCIIYFARELSAFILFGWPLSFYMAAQGLVLVYVLIVALYAWAMRRIDRILKAGGGDAR